MKPNLNAFIKIYNNISTIVKSLMILIGKEKIVTC